jgi:hypothetical protein
MRPSNFSPIFALALLGCGVSLDGLEFGDAGPPPSLLLPPPPAAVVSAPPDAGAPLPEASPEASTPPTPSHLVQACDRPRVFDATPDLGDSSEPTTCNLDALFGSADAGSAGLDVDSAGNWSIIRFQGPTEVEGRGVTACIGLDYGVPVALGTITIASHAELDACGDSPCNPNDDTACLAMPGQLVAFVGDDLALMAAMLGPTSPALGLVAVTTTPARYLLVCRDGTVQPSQGLAKIGIDSVTTEGCAR